MNDQHNIPRGDGANENRLNDLYDELKINFDPAAAERSFESDAGTGLTQLSPSEKERLVLQLNTQLRKDLHKRPRRRGLTDQSMTMLIIITVLLLIVMSFIVIRAMS